MLQTRSGKRAALRMAVEMAEEGLITRDEALLGIAPIALDQLLHPTLDPDAEKTVLTQAAGTPGAAAGEIVLSADRAEERQAGPGDPCPAGDKPQDIHGMHAAGILTARVDDKPCGGCGARHGRACVSGAGDLRFDESLGGLYPRSRIA